MIAVGAFSPLKGYMAQRDYQNVLDNMRLDSGLVWTIPITLPVTREMANSLKIGKNIALLDTEKTPVAVLHLEEKYKYDKDKEALQIFDTVDEWHPGVSKLFSSGDILLGGDISVIHRKKHRLFEHYRLDPVETRYLFRKKGWKRIVAFQTRNPVHRAHEYLQKCALEAVDGLLLHPLVGETKKDDIPVEIRIKSYEAVLDKYYPKDRTVMSIFPAYMRYAGPKEAVFHALCRKNYGCSHFIVGRDHAGTGNFYHTFAAHWIFDEFEEAEIGITPFFYDYTFYCKSCGGMASYKTCPHDSSAHIMLSGTRVRELLAKGKMPPIEITRKEVAELLIEGMKGDNK
jgi:sulfate adenylyltransferase